MAADAAPLLKIFLKLRARGFPLGVEEYLQALRALEAGFGNGNRQELISLCQTLWAKSPEELAQVAEVCKAELPAQLPPDKIAEYVEHLAGAEQPMRRQPLPVETPTPSSAPTETQQSPTATTSTTLPATQTTLALHLAPEAQPDDVYLPPAVSSWPLNARYDLSGRLPVTKRQLKNAWRHYRRMQRVGQPTEIDVPATIERMHQQGIFLAPVLIPRRTNLARLLLLMDEGGSMTPFRYLLRPLLESAKQSGLHQVGAYYFHDVPVQYLYHDPRLSETAPLEEVLNTFAGTGVLIVSDGGAARGHYDEKRLAQTISFCETLKCFRTNFAWLNPMPATRWPGTTAERIRTQCQLTMLPFNRTGMDAAVDVLRGRKR